VSRPGYLLRDAALGYASRGIPVLPLHYPVAHLDSARVLGDGRVSAPQVRYGPPARAGTGPAGRSASTPSAPWSPTV
jgi:hypothetical protein